jgi:hypothetical protein
MEEKIPRIVGSRTKAPNGLSEKDSNREVAAEWRRAFGGVRVPRGVYRFRTHEEADEWLWRNISRPTG